MSRVRVLVGTRKGAFVLTADASAINGRSAGRISPAGRSITSRDAADQDRLYASQSSGWFGQVIQRSDDGGASWEPVGTTSIIRPNGYPPVVRRHSAPLEFAGSGTWSRRWTTRMPSTPVWKTPGFSARTTAGSTGRNCPGSAAPSRGRRGSPERAGCACTRSPGSVRAGRIFTAISAAGAFRSDDAGQTWQPVNRGLHSEGIRTAARGRPLRAPPGHAPVRPSGCLCRALDVMRSDDAGESWREISGDLRPTSLPHRRACTRAGDRYVVPITATRTISRPRGSCGSTQPHRRGRVGAAHPGPAAGALLRQRAEGCDGRRLLESCGIYFAPPAARCTPARGDSWAPIVRTCRRAVGRGAAPSCPQTLMPPGWRSSGALPARLRTLADQRMVGCRSRPNSGLVLARWKPGTRCCAGTIRDRGREAPGVFIKFFACERTCRTTTGCPLPGRSRRAPSRTDRRAWRAAAQRGRQR